MKEKEIKKAAEEIRPQLESMGIEFNLTETTEEGIVKIRTGGANRNKSGCHMSRRSPAGCGGCTMNQDAALLIIEEALKEKIPEIKRVEKA